ncbi:MULTISPECIES: CBS domain-containing protein [unclassified Colwellia]|uniref:CBS domain-containing protein n=1 Tax=unclassified Colwellia TaxID=196834 RepID=UPI0015F64C42|nr:MULTISPECIES: CBS domain-containing protein [unclassified Colwellia]MBA6233358.1 CBS domain-containing protein [Colwellia sp. MB02u-7]MBA6236448.1 CBS domain-containing protein [Colwellia sp. MB02u-11]MBA6256982.1 CBS domain-containing protein [Colwellia sp. MB3u-28]MBA6261013.1 CBS domain-containing protein [Colwellia sp. MB3u-41]MBA6298153.1 CBS domain-containing protein [Colwellia sp. MB3u-22]
MSLSKVMSKNLITLEIDDDLSKAKAIFDQHNIHHILILCDKQLVGVVTDRDLYKHLSPTIGTKNETPRDHSMLQKKLHLIMNRNLITAEKETSLNDAVLLFYDNHISCLPIVDNSMQPIGIVSWRDILKVLALQYRLKLATIK